MDKIQTHTELRKFLFRAGLKQNEIGEAMETLGPQLDAGGISEFELKKALKKLRNGHKISSVDKKNIMEGFEDK